MRACVRVYFKGTHHGHDELRPDHLRQAVLNDVQKYVGAMEGKRSAVEVTRPDHVSFRSL